MDTDRLGNEAVLFATVFFVTLFILGYLEVNHYTSIGLFVGIFPFVWGTGFAFEYEVLHSLKHENVTKNRRRIFFLCLGSFATVQLFCVFDYLGFYTMSFPFYLWIVLHGIIFVTIIFIISRIAIVKK
jgi:hypothetical protein